MTNPDSVLKSRDITLLTKVQIVKAMIFPVVIYRYDSCTIQKAEHWRIDAFKLLCWRRFLRVPWIARRSNQIILKEINPECSLEGLMLRLKLQYFGHLMQRADSLETTLMLGKIEGRRKLTKDDTIVEWHHRFSGREFEQTPGDSEGQGRLVCYSLRSQRVVFDWVTEQQQQSKLRWVFTYLKYPKVQLGIFKNFHSTLKVYLYLVSISFTCQKTIL